MFRCEFLEWKNAVEIEIPSHMPSGIPLRKRKQKQQDATKKSKSHRIKPFGIAPNLKIYCFYDKRWICFWATLKFHLS